LNRLWLLGLRMNKVISGYLRGVGRFLYRNQCSTLVIPPLTRGAGPILDTNGLYRLHHYLKVRSSLLLRGVTSFVAAARASGRALGS
jgi:hypothetical protein